VVEIGRTLAQSQPSKKLARPHFNKQASCSTHTYNPSYMRSIGRRIIVQDQPEAKRKGYRHRSSDILLAGPRP
jgi:hypothetical protein